jgi:hypothetical protein
MAWIRRIEWTAVGVLAGVAFALGVLGMRWHMSTHGAEASWADAIYFSIRLFTFEFDFSGDGGAPYDADNWLLQIARFLAPATLAFAVIKGLMLAAASQFNLWAIARWTGHAVVCGGGERGRQLVLALRQEGQRVVVIEPNEQADALPEIREAGARVVIGSGTDPARQADAKLDTAKTVVAVTPCEESNLQIVLAASRRRNRRPLRAIAHATRSFAEMFETQPPFNRVTADSECGFFDHDVSAARLLIGKYAPDLGPALVKDNRPARVLLAGDGDIIPELLGVVVTQCQYAGPGIPAITLLTVDPDAVARQFPLHHPQLGLVTDLCVRILPLPQLLRFDFASLATNGQGKPFDLVFVACREDIDTLTLSRNLAQQSDWLTSDVIAGLRPSTQLMRLFIGKQPLAGVQAHDLVALGCSGEIVLHGRLDRIARGIHEAYRADQLRAGQSQGSSPALVPWEELPEGLRQANRAQADNIPIKQRLLATSQSDDMIEALAIAEHRRWMAEKIVAGWRHAPQRDDARRLHPSIRPYDALSEAEKQKDRNTVLTAMTSG